jgi:hypothetical protein
MSTITAPTTRPPAPRRSSSVRRGLLVVVLAVVVGLTALLAQLGCQRMREVAPIGATDGHGRTVTGHTWSLHPAGFTVRYDDGTAFTQLWW